MKKLLASLIVFALTLSLGALLHASPLLDQANRKLTHGFYQEREASEEILIVAIDDLTLSAPEEGGLGTMSEWPRSFWIDVIEEIRAGGAKGIFVDVMFLNASQSVSYYEIASLYQETRSTEEVGERLLENLAQDYSDQDHALAGVFSKEDTFLIKAPTGEPVLNNNLVQILGERGSIAPLYTAAQNVFASSSGQEGQDIFYSLPIGFVTNGEFEAAAALSLAEQVLGTRGALSADNQSYRLGDKDIPIENGELLINYATRPYEYPRVSFSRVFREANSQNSQSKLGGVASESHYEDKIVMIGATAAILQDRHFTPIDSSQPMPGVEIQANALQTILDGEFLVHQKLGHFLFWTGVLLALGIVSFMYLPIWWSFGVLLLEFIAFPFLSRMHFNSGVIPDLVWPLATLLLAYFAVFAYRYFTEFLEKRRLRNAFSHYVSSDLVRSITSNPGQLLLGGERRPLTVFFLDIEGFTALSESLSPEAVVELINRYFDAFTEIILEHGGTVDKFEGDAIMALFGAPVQLEDRSLRAIEAALAIQARCVELNAEASSNPINVRIGIASGEAIVGNMGSEERFDYTAMGAVVNLASRLQEANKTLSTRMLVNDVAAQEASASLKEAAAKNMQASQSFGFQKHEGLSIKGFSQAQVVYSIAPGTSNQS